MSIPGPVTPKKSFTRKKERSSNICRFCRTNVGIVYGKAIPSVPIFKCSASKDFMGVCLKDKLLSIGIKLKQEEFVPSSCCRKCARKIVSTEEHFSFLKKAINGLDEENDTVTKRGLRSPEGKQSKRVRTTQPLRSLQEQTQQTSAKCLSFEYAESDVEDTVRGLMSLPVNTEETSFVKIFVGYQNTGKVHQYKCEGKEKGLVRNIAKGNFKAAAHAAIEVLGNALIDAYSKKVLQEMKAYIKGECLLKYNGNPEVLPQFTNEMFVNQLKEKVPHFGQVVEDVCKGNVNRIALAGSACAGSLTKSNVYSKKVNIILHEGGCKGPAVGRLNKLGICDSPKTNVRLMTEVAKRVDKQVVQWKRDIELKEKSLRLLQEVKDNQSKAEVDEDHMEVDAVFSYDIIKSYTHFDQEVYEHCLMIINHITDIHFDINDIHTAYDIIEKKYIPLFRLVIDNYDQEIKARVQSSSLNNKSIHVTNGYAVKNRVSRKDLSSDKPQMSLGDLNVITVLPGKNVINDLKDDFVHIIPRIIVRRLAAYAKFSRSVIYHIPHDYSKEMEAKSEMQCLGIHMFDTNKSPEMAGMLKVLQEKYVPSDGEDIIKVIPLDGDQLTEERARNVQWTFHFGETPKERLEGLEPTFADWHMKRYLYDISHNLFVKDESVAEIGTTQSSIVRTSKTNARPGPLKDYNAYKNMYDCETEAHLLAAWMEFTGMSTMNDTPQKRPIPGIEKWDKKQKREWLYNEVKDFLEKDVFLKNKTSVPLEAVTELEIHQNHGFPCRECGKVYAFQSGRVRHEKSTHPAMEVDDGGDEERDKYGYYKCRYSCGLVFKTAATRDRHHRQTHNGFTHEGNAMQVTQGSKKEDYLFNYHLARLQFGLFLEDLNDAIREGDGARLFRCLKVALPFFYKTNHTKYSYVVLLFICKVVAILPQEQAFNLLHNRFYNHSEEKGRNISLDLRMEQINLVCKTSLRFVGSNFTKNSAERISKSVSFIEKVLEGIDKECNKTKRSGRHGIKGGDKEAVEIIVNDLNSRSVFKFEAGRKGHQSFPKFDLNLLNDFDYRDFFSWAKNHFQEWKSIYEPV